jgi:hypothetical protein
MIEVRSRMSHLERDAVERVGFEDRLASMISIVELLA